MTNAPRKPFTHHDLLEWIDNRWKETLRSTPEDTPERFGLPRSYLVPCAREGFQDFFYWDTVFACMGLLTRGDPHVAYDSYLGIITLIKRFGYMPNAAKPSMLNRSQPPLLGALMAEIEDFCRTDRYVREDIGVLEQEYNFWMKERLLPCGLNHYGHNATDDYLYDFCGWCAPRIHRDPPKTRQARLRLGANLLAEAESGWDFNARFNHQALDYAPVDLNAILYGNEIRMATWYGKFGERKKSEMFSELTRKRGELLHELCYSPKTGCFHDYNAKTKKQSPLVTAASYFPIWCYCCMRDEDDLVNRMLAALEEKLWTPYGVMATEKLPAGTVACQWDAPSIWPPLQIVALKALKRVHRTKDAKRLAANFSECVLRVFNETGDLWEKYDGFTGGICTANAEYGTPSMMGWTAAAYIICRDIVTSKEA